MEMTHENPKTAAVSTSEENKISLMDILILLARRKKFILCASFAAALLVAVIVFLLPNQYTAQAVLMPPSQGPSAGSSLLSQLAGGSGAMASLGAGGLGLKTPADMYVSLFQTETVENALIQRFGLMGRYKKKVPSDTRKALESKARVALGAKDGLIRISVEDKDPKFAAGLANGYVEEFRRLFADLAVTEAAQRRVFFENQLKQAKDNLANAEVDMRNTEQATGVLQIDSQARALIESAASLRAQIAAKQVQIQAMHSFAADENPEIQVARQQLIGLQEQLSALLGPGREGDQDLLIAKGKVPEAGMIYIRKLRDVKYYETIYESIAKQFELAKLDEARQGALVQVVDPATPPDRKSSPHRTITVLAVFLVALLFTSAYVVVREMFGKLEEDPRWQHKAYVLRQTLRGKS